MPAKSKADASLGQSCRICGGGGNPAGACVVCGTKQVTTVQKKTVVVDASTRSESGTSSPADGPSPADSGFSSWLGGPSTQSAAAHADALRKWLAGGGAALQEGARGGG